VQHIRVEADAWRRFGALVGDKERAALLRDFIRWWLREPGVTMPRRPPRRDPGE
jgi:hypothetical protein